MNNSDTIALFGELLLRLSPPAGRKIIQTDTLEMHWAGSEANIAVGLANLGLRARFVTAVPENELAASGIMALHRYGVDVSYIRKEGERIGTFFYEPGSGIRNGKIIYDRAHSSFSALRPGSIDWAGVFEGCGWFHWSGINAGISNELALVCEEALKAASAMGIFVTADCNHRNALWKYGKHPRDVMPRLLQYCRLVVADMNVGNLYYGIEPDKNRTAESFLEKISGELAPGTSIAMTVRGSLNGKGNSSDYRAYLYHNREIFTSAAYSLEHTIERIGTGDAFMSGLLYGFVNGMEAAGIIDFAAAAGAYKHTVTGDFTLASVEDIKSILKNPRTGVILR